MHNTITFNAVLEEQERENYPIAAQVEMKPCNPVFAFNITDSTKENVLYSFLSNLSAS